MKSIFISSTFKDMNEERDLFHERIAPELNDIARGYGESISFCDLRWGVDTSELESEEGCRKVLSVCLDEIDRCKPYMVVLLGERYGWIPSQDLIAGAIKSRRQFTLDELEKSVTALEIEYGALRDSEQLKRTLFYFRELEGNFPPEYRTEDDAHARKLAALKQRIIDATGGRVKTYHVRWDSETKRICGLEDFAAMVTADIRALMEREWKALAALSPFEKDLHGQWDMLEQKGAQFTARQDLIDRYTALLRHGTACFAIQGPSGSGKSTLMSRLGLELRQSGREVLPIFCGSTDLCSTAADVLRYMVQYLETLPSLPAPGTPAPEPDAPLTQWQNRLQELVDLYHKTQPKTLVILIDAVDQLFPDEDRDHLRFLPQNLPGQVKVVLSCLDTFPLSPAICTQQVPALEEADRGTIIRGILAPTGKDLGDSVVATISQKDGGDKPLYLSLLITRLEMMDQDDFEAINRQGGGIDEINQHQIEIIRGCASDLNALCVEILEAASEKLGSDMTFAAAEFLAVSRFGLREQDLEGVFSILGLHWDSLSFSRFRKYMHRFFIQRPDGRLDFSHQSFRRGFLSRIGDQKFHHTILLQYFQTLPLTDDIRIREIIHHCILADDKEYFVQYARDNHTDKPIICHAASAAVSLALADDGAWIKAMLQCGAAAAESSHILAFVVFDFIGAFSAESQQNIMLKKNVLEDTVRFAENAAKIHPTYVIRRNYSVALHLLGRLLRDLGGQDNLDRAMVLLEQGLEIDEYYARIHPTPRTKLDLSVSYDRLAGLYNQMGGKENLQKALAFFQKSLALRSELLEQEDSTRNMRNYSIACANVADMHMQMDGTKNIHAALDLYREAKSLREKVLKQENTPEARQDLASIISKIAAVHRKFSDKQSLQSAVKGYRAAIELQVQNVRELGTPGSRINLSHTLGSLIDVLQALGGKKELEEALSLCKFLVETSEVIESELGTAASRERLATAYSRCGSIYLAFGNEENLRLSLQCHQQALEIRSQLAENPGGSGALRSLALTYGKVAVIYHYLGGIENLEKALEYAQRTLDLREKLVHQLGMTQSRDELVAIYHVIGDILRKLGGELNLQEAMILYRKAMELSEQVHTELSTVQSLRSVLISCNKLGHLYRVMDGRENLELALEAYRKGLDHSEALYDRQGTTTAAEDLSISCTNVADILRKLGGPENLEQAKKLLTEALSLAEKVHEARNTPDSRYDLYVSCSKLGSLCLDLGSLREALAAYRRAAELQTEIDRNRPSPKTKEELSSTCTRLAETLQKLGGRENLLEAAAMYQKVLEAEQALMEMDMTKSGRALKNQGIVLDRMGSIFQTLGGQERLMQALDLFEKSLAVRQQLNEVRPGAESRRELLVSHSKLGGILRATGGGEDLDRSLEHYLQSFAVADALAKELKTVSAYSDLIAVLYSLGVHPCVPATERRQYLERMLKLSMLLFQKTGNEKFRKYAATAQKLLKQLDT